VKKSGGLEPFGKCRVSLTNSEEPGNPETSLGFCKMEETL